MLKLCFLFISADFRNPCRIKRDISQYSKRFHIPNKIASEKFPFSAAVKLGTRCTGVAVTERHVITAAHCVTSVRGPRRKIGKIICHQYQGFSLASSRLLLHLKVRHGHFIGHFYPDYSVPITRYCQ